MSNKTNFVASMQKAATTQGQQQAVLKTIYETYFDRGYNAGGADELTDEDVASLGVTAADVAGFITVCEQFGNFMTGQAVMTGDYSVATNKMRVDL